MLKILILDADAENIKNFKQYLKMSFSSIKSVYTLSDTTKNIQNVVRETAPELVVADIRFFGPSAHKILRGINETNHDIKFILYGTFNDSEYINKCMEFGVIDYMYRPVKPSDFRRCMEKALVFFEAFHESKHREAQMELSYREKVEFFQDKFLASLVKGYIVNEKEIRRSFIYFGLPFERDFTVFIVRIDHYNKIILTLEEMEKHMLIYKICQIANEKIEASDMTGIAFIDQFNCATCLVSGAGELERLMQFCEALKEAIYHNSKTRVTIGIGRQYESCTDIPVSHNEADAALRYRFHIGYNTVIPIHFVEPNNNITYRYPILRENRLVYTAVIGEYEYCMKLVRELLDSLREIGGLPDKLIPKIVMDIIISINRYASEQNITEDGRFTEFFPSSGALQIKSVDEAYDYLETSLKGFCGHMMERRTADNEDLLARAREYVDVHFYENISLQKVATILYTTPEYLNKLFIDTLKRTLYEYSVEARIEHAKKLLLETELDDDVIAVNSGYDDVRHFRGVFKQYTGLTLSEYKAQNKRRWLD